MIQVSNPWEVAMNAFYEHHKDSIQLRYQCFDRGCAT